MFGGLGGIERETEEKPCVSPKWEIIPFFVCCMIGCLETFFFCFSLCWFDCVAKTV